MSNSWRQARTYSREELRAGLQQGNLPDVSFVAQLKWINSSSITLNSTIPIVRKRISLHSLHKAKKTTYSLLKSI